MSSGRVRWCAALVAAAALFLNGCTAACETLGLDHTEVPDIVDAQLPANLDVLGTRLHCGEHDDDVCLLSVLVTDGSGVVESEQQLLDGMLAHYATRGRDLELGTGDCPPDEHECVMLTAGSDFDAVPDAEQPDLWAAYGLDDPTPLQNGQLPFAEVTVATFPRNCPR